MVRIGEAVSATEVDAVRELMRAYGAHLAAGSNGAAGICLADHEAELRGLPGPYAAPRGVLLLARVEDAPAACVAVRPLSHDRGWAEGCELKRLWVGTAFRGLGLGRGLMEAAIGWAREAGYAALYLDTVAAAMPEANALYGRMGFARVERYNSNPVADVIFYKLGLS